MYTNWKMLKTILHPENPTDEDLKRAEEAQKEYTNVAIWCNENQQYHIEDTGECYETVKNPEPTHKEILEYEMHQLKMFLEDTDYVTAKLVEVIDDHEAYTTMKLHYKDILDSRNTARIRIREIEKELEEESE